MSENLVESEAPQTIRRMHIAYWLSKATRAKAHSRARAPTPTPRRMHAHACTHTRTLTHAHTHSQKHVILTAFRRQKLLRERALILH